MLLAIVPAEPASSKGFFVSFRTLAQTGGIALFRSRNIAGPI